MSLDPCRARILLPFALFLAVACSDKNSGSLDGGGAGDAGAADTGLDSDGAIIGADAEPADLGPPPPCQRDQGGAANRGCEPGFVCNLGMNPPECVPGLACTTTNDCNNCSNLQTPTDCHHGYKLTAWCDPNHGNVCTRSRSPCEPCTATADCGRQDPLLGGDANECIDYGDTKKFCGRPDTFSCPDGFQSNGTQCVRMAGCADEPSICPAEAGTPGTQIANRAECPGTGGARCATNDVPGALGLCVGFCTDNAQCPANLPYCNPNGICITAPCMPGNCPSGLVCQPNGCRPACVDDAQCATNFGAGFYCNIAGRALPTLYKSYRDANSCAPLGCEKRGDCVQEQVCDSAMSPPTCIAGCRDNMDCSAEKRCKVGMPSRTYNIQECRGLAGHDSQTTVGVCCDPGCLDRATDCPAVGDFCCGEEDSPYENPISCPSGAQAGTCFPFPSPAPWCSTCDGTPGQCNSGYSFGYNTDPSINGGQPFQEQEFCTLIGQMPDIAICTVTCAPTGADNGCPGRWACAPNFVPCFEAADCGGIECIGADMAMMRPGRCKCGENGTASAACPVEDLNMQAIDNPRCVPVGTDMFCISSFTCRPPSFNGNNYPAGCGF